MAEYNDEIFVVYSELDHGPEGVDTDLLVWCGTEAEAGARIAEYAAVVSADPCCGLIFKYKSLTHRDSR